MGAGLNVCGRDVDSSHDDRTYLIRHEGPDLVCGHFRLLIAQILSFAVTELNVIFLHRVVHSKRTKIYCISVLH